MKENPFKRWVRAALFGDEPKIRREVVVATSPKEPEPPEPVKPPFECIKIPENEVRYFAASVGADVRRNCYGSDLPVEFYFVRERGGEERVVVFPSGLLEERGVFVIRDREESEASMAVFLDGEVANLRAGYHAMSEDWIKVSILAHRRGNIPLSASDEQSINLMIEPYSPKYKYSLESRGLRVPFWDYYAGPMKSTNVWVRRAEFGFLKLDDVGVENSVTYDSGVWQVFNSYGMQFLDKEEVFRRGVYGGSSTGRVDPKVLLLGGQ